MLEILKSARHLQLLVKWEVVSPNSRYREFYHEIGNIEKCLFTYWLNGGVVQWLRTGTLQCLVKIIFFAFFNSTWYIDDILTGWELVTSLAFL